MKKTLLGFYLSYITLCQAQNSRFYQLTNLDYYEIQEETETLKSPLQCCIYCRQGHCCEGAIYEGPVCKLLQNVQLSKNQSRPEAWIDSDILSRGLATDKVLLITGDPKEESKVAELVDLKTQVSCLTIEFPIELESAFGGQLSQTDLLICGGVNQGITQTNCFHVNLQNGELTEMPNHLVEPRSSGGYLTIKDVGLWIIGGNNESNVPSKTTLIANMEQTSYGPNLPDTWTKMCTAKINESSFFVAGI